MTVLPSHLRNTINLSDVLIFLRSLPDCCVHTCVTSPPYFRLRDYGIEGQIGLEQTVDEYVAKMVEVFREVRRVLRDDGTCWLNLGDSYANDAKWGGSSSGKRAKALHGGDHTRDRARSGFAHKQLLMIPHRVAMALQADGWYVRSDIVWAKPSPMPESVLDRPTRAHEFIFLLAKSRYYFYDIDAIREPIAESSKQRYRYGHHGKPHRQHVGNQRAQNSNRWMNDENAKRKSMMRGRNKTSVWWVAPKAYRGAHFATFPPELITPCILAGCPRQTCEICGAPYVRVYSKEFRLNPDRSQAKRALELFKQARLTDDHLAAIRAYGLADADKAHKVRIGAGDNTKETRQLALEAKKALRGYYREFLFGERRFLVFNQLAPATPTHSLASPSIHLWAAAQPPTPPSDCSVISLAAN